MEKVTRVLGGKEVPCIKIPHLAQWRNSRDRATLRTWLKLKK